jgi:hypothetical protein
VILGVAIVLLGCSEGGQPPGTSGRKPSLTQGADEFMKVYGGVESGVGDAQKDPTSEKKDPPPEKK